MPFWRRKKSEDRERGPAARAAQPDAEDAAAEAAAADADALAEAALDTVAAFLRCYGGEAFDTERMDAAALRDCCERWAQHVLVGAPEPGATRVDAETGAVPVGPPRRNWPGVRHFVADHRRDEVHFVMDGFGHLREAVWAFIQALSQSVVADRGDEAKLLRQMHRLKSSVDRAALPEIRNQALEAVQLVREVVQQRGERQRRQMKALGERVGAMRNTLNRARREASTDGLTGLFNRTALDEHLERVTELGIAFGRSACLLMVDVDHFKWVNDRYGHPAGDAVLRALGDCLSKVFLRRADFVARYGGEEFAVVLDAEELDGARVAAERMLEAVRDLEVEVDGEMLRVTASAGLSRLVPGEPQQDWLDRADRALYEAKQAGRDRLALERRVED
jgi:diguanylate cyclase